MLGMLALGVSFLYGVAVAAAITVAFTVLAALTLLPALLALFGGRVLRRRERRAIASAVAERRVAAHGRAGRGSCSAARLLFAALARSCVMIVIAMPFFSMRLGSADAGSDPTGHDDLQGLRAARQGLRARLQRSARARRAGRAHPRSARSSSRHRRRRTPDVASATTPTFLPGRVRPAQVARRQRVPEGLAQAVSTANLLNRCAPA
jgi:RND superfamily putative drug exporter